MISSKLFCAIRRQQVRASSEELLRQSTVQKLIALGYPASLMGLEKKLKVLPGKQQQSPPYRRVDIVCFSPSCLGAEPLVLIECKTGSFHEKAMRQLLGYNLYIRALFVVLVNTKGIWCARFDKSAGSYAWVEDLPSYQEALVQGE